MSYTHKCVKCSTSYQTEDEEAYYCETCLEARKQFTKEIDAKHATNPKEHIKSDLQIALEKGQRKNGSLFVRASDLGISFNG